MTNRAASAGLRLVPQSPASSSYGRADGLVSVTAATGRRTSSRPSGSGQAARASSPGRARSPSASAPASWRLSPLGNLFAGDPLFGGDRDDYDHGQDDGARYANDASDDADYADDASDDADYDSGGFDGGGL